MCSSQKEYDNDDDDIKGQIYVRTFEFPIISLKKIKKAKREIRNQRGSLFFLYTTLFTPIY